jgi:hypothetical protein
LSLRRKLFLGADALGSAFSVNVITEEPRFALSVQKDAPCLKFFSAWLHLLYSLSAEQSGRSESIGCGNWEAKETSTSLSLNRHVRRAVPETG